MPSEYVSIKEAAAMMSVSRPTVWRRIKAAGLEVFHSSRDGRERLVRRSDIEALMIPHPVEPDAKKLAA